MTQHTGTVNGWTITKRLAGDPAQYYVAKKMGRVKTSKDLSYLRRVCK